MKNRFEKGNMIFTKPNELAMPYNPPRGMSEQKTAWSPQLFIKSAGRFLRSQGRLFAGKSCPPVPRGNYMALPASGCRKKTNSFPKGFTLAEILLYFTIAGVVMFAAITFSIQIIKVESFSKNYRELEANANFIERRIDIAVKTAESIDDTNSAFEDEEGVLSLNMKDPQKSPTKFYFSGGNIFMQEGTGESVKINSERVEVEYLIFKKYTYPKTPDQINAGAKLSPKNGDMAGMENDITMHLTTSLRKI